MVKRIIIILTAFIALFISGCNINGKIEDIESKKVAVKCVEEDEYSFLEMFDIFIRFDLKSITCSSEDSYNIAFDGKFYNIIAASKDVDPSDKDLLRACEILGELFTAYGINEIRYYSDDRCIQMRFAGNTRALSYSPDTTPPNDLGEEKIKDGFYTYMLKPMF